ncbi:UNVERIFIED_CONTAM: hypothetical protein Sindi_0052500, partial [Sesamum indicum]
MATSNGFFFFQFKYVIDMEETIEGGPWLFQGQPIILQKWEPGMVMRKLKHKQVPVWIKLRHLLMEYWTREGLSTIAGEIGRPLYTDAITRACTRLDFARVCVMLDITSKLPKHVIIMTLDKEGGETPCKIDVEDEWVHPKCTGCMRKWFMDCVTMGNLIWIGWDENFIDVEVVEMSSQFIHCHVTIRALQETIDITAIYGASELADRRLLWHSLGTLAIQCVDTPWLFGGDFNAVRDLSEVCGASGDIWQRRNKGDLSHNVQLAKGFLEEAQILVCSNRQEAMFLYLEHCCWMGENGLDEGDDQCSRVFFRKIAQRRTVRRILQITDDHKVTHTEQGAVINEFVSYYWDMLRGERRRNVIDIRFLRLWARHIISEDETTSLLLPFTPSDVKKAVFDIAEDEAPGPDGYSSGFFKVAWSIVGEEVHSPMSVNDFRPISCCNILYKIIAKLIVQRLSVVLDKIISPCQAAFVPGRSIKDNIMLAQELFSGYNQTHLPPRCALKVDIQKVYDTFEWDFVMAVLELNGFQPIFIRWIVECVSTPSFSMGMNGKPHGFFSGARGLRQGDPLLPYLFVLIMEVLHLHFLQMIEQDRQFAYNWKCEASRVFQLGFADNLFLLYRADNGSLEVFKRGLEQFAEWLGLRINLQKSHLIISWSAQGFREDLLVLLGFQEGHLPMRHLGLPFFSSRLSITDCQPLLLKIDQRIAGWEGLAISYAGRVQIIKFVLTSLSVYWASAFILPKKIIKEIEKRLRTFFWRTGTSGYAK